MNKRCRDCHLDLPLEEFHASKKGAQGRASYCKRCTSIRNARYAARGVVNPRERKVCPDCQREKLASEFHRSQRRADGLTPYCKACWADRERERRYDIDPAQLAEMISEQGARCAICRERTALVVDHCHSSGEVRGLLCGHCNRGLGLFKDDPTRLDAAIAYLNR